MFSKVSLQVALASIVALFSVSAQATTVLQVDVDYLLEHAELVFEGEVTSHEAHWNENKTAIYKQTSTINFFPNHASRKYETNNHK